MSHWSAIENHFTVLNELAKTELIENRHKLGEETQNYQNNVMKEAIEKGTFVSYLADTHAVQAGSGLEPLMLLATIKTELDRQVGQLNLGTKSVQVLL